MRGTIGESVAHAIDSLDSIAEALKVAQSRRERLADGAVDAGRDRRAGQRECRPRRPRSGLHRRVDGARTRRCRSYSPGLRGSEAALAAFAERSDAASAARLVAAAVALGVGRAAIAHAIAAMKTSRRASRAGRDRAALGVRRRRDGSRRRAAADLRRGADARSTTRTRRDGDRRARNGFAAQRREQAVDAAIQGLKARAATFARRRARAPHRATPGPSSHSCTEQSTPARRLPRPRHPRIVLGDRHRAACWSCLRRSGRSSRRDTASRPGIPSRSRCRRTG